MSGLTEAELEEVCLDYLGDAGWARAFGPDLAPGGSAAERSEYAEVLLVGRLRHALAKLNPDLPEAAQADVAAALGRAESQVLLSENWRVYRLLSEGVPVEYRDANGRVVQTRARLLDWESPDNNDWLAVNQLTVVQDGRKRIPDIVCFRLGGLGEVWVELRERVPEPSY